MLKILGVLCAAGAFFAADMFGLTEAVLMPPSSVRVRQKPFSCETSAVPYLIRIGIQCWLLAPLLYAALWIAAGFHFVSNRMQRRA